MLFQDLVVCLQLTADKIISKNPPDCLLHLPCNCSHPGKELCCENCEYLEACLSQKRMLERKQGIGTETKFVSNI